MNEEFSIAHIVKDGEHLASIAHRYGASPADIWDHPANEDLKNRRKTWNVLAAGDVVYIKKRDGSWFQVSAGTSKTFAARVERIKIKLTLRDERGPIKNENFVAHARAGKFEGKTGGDGQVELDVSVLDQIIKLELTDRNHSVVLQVGGLDPVETMTGLRARLFHLGFLKHHSSSSVLDAQTLAALREFQKAKRLQVNGELDNATIAALREAFGC